MLSINTNFASMYAQQNLATSQASAQTAMQRLSSGLRINSAKDDAAGLAISDGMTSEIRGNTVAVRNANDGVSMMQTADGALGTITENLQRMRDLATQASNGGALSAADQTKLQTEFGQLQTEISRVINVTQFNGKQVLAGGLDGTSSTFQVGAYNTVNDQINVNIGTGLAAGAGNLTANTNITAITTAGASSPNTSSQISTTADAQAALVNIDSALGDIDTYRANIGAYQNRFTSAVSNLQSSIQNQSAARSRILDTDFATETSNLSKAQILQQAGMAMLSQANQSGQGVLSLLR